MATSRRVAATLDLQRPRKPLGPVLQGDQAEVLDEHGHAHDAAEDVEGALRWKLRPHDARMPVAEVPALEQRGGGVHLDLAGVQEALEVAAVDRVANHREAAQPLDEPAVKSGWSARCVQRSVGTQTQSARRAKQTNATNARWNVNRPSSFIVVGLTSIRDHACGPGAYPPAADGPPACRSSGCPREPRDSHSASEPGCPYPPN